MLWFEVKVKYYKTGEDGQEENISENYLFDAVSWTDAETKVTEEMNKISSGGFVIESIKKSKIVDVFAYDSGEYWLKVALDMVTLDESAGKEKKIKEHYLILANDIQQGLTRINKSLDSSTVPYYITGISVSNIVEIFPYTKK